MGRQLPTLIPAMSWFVAEFTRIITRLSISSPTLLVFVSCVGPCVHTPLAQPFAATFPRMATFSAVGAQEIPVMVSITVSAHRFGWSLCACWFLLDIVILVWC